jgi:hypothetical protein
MSGYASPNSAFKLRNISYKVWGQCCRESHALHLCDKNHEERAKTFRARNESAGRWAGRGINKRS